MDFSRHTELIEGVVNQLIDEEALGVCLEMHRAIKLGYYELLYPEDSVYEKQVIVDVRGLDIFGCSPHAPKKNVDCICPNCSRLLGAMKFAPHLEKCMGMGRNSSRLAATKKLKPPVVVESEPEGSEDNEDEWTYPEVPRKSGGGGGGGKKHKKDKTPAYSSSPNRNGRGPGRPPKQKEKGGGGGGGGSDNTQNGEVHNSSGGFHSLKPSQQMHTVHSFKELSSDHKIRLLDQICGVVSERTGRLCTRSINCPQHMEEQRLELRTILLKERNHEVISPPQKRSKSAHQSPPIEDMDVDDGFRLRPISETALIRKKKKASKKGKRGHNITTATTVLHSSSMF